MAIAVLALLIALSGGTVAALPAMFQSSPDGGCAEWRACRQLALAAAERGEYGTFHDLAWRAVQTGPPKDPVADVPARSRSSVERPPARRTRSCSSVWRRWGWHRTRPRTKISSASGSFATGPTWKLVLPRLPAPPTVSNAAVTAAIPSAAIAHRPPAIAVPSRRPRRRRALRPRHRPCVSRRNSLRSAGSPTMRPRADSCWAIALDAS